MLAPLVLATLLLQVTQDAPAAPPKPDAPAQVEKPDRPRTPQAPRSPPAPPRVPIPPPPGAGDVLRGDFAGEPSGARVTIEDTTSIDDALEQIADAAGWNVVINTGRTGHKLLVLKLRNVPVEEALRAAISGTELAATKTGNTVVVAPGGIRPPAPPEPPPATLSGFDKPTGKKFTGDFEETPAGDAIRQIAKAAALSIVLPPGPTPEVTASFHDVPVEDALRAVLDQAGLVAKREGTLVTVRRAGGRFGALLPPGMPEEARRAAEEGMREAERALRDLHGDEAPSGRDEDFVDWGGRDRQSTGSDVTIASGERVRDVNVVKGDLLVEGGGQTRDVSTVSGSVELESGAQSRDVVAVLGSVRLAGGSRARQVVAVGGDVEIGPGAFVDNDVVAVGGRVTIDPAARVGGSRQSISIPGLPSLIGVATGHVFAGPPSPAWIAFEAIVKFAVLFVLGLLVLSLFPRRVEAVSASMVASPVKNTFAGLLGTVALPILLVLLVVTVVGILLVPVQIIAVIAAGVLGVTALTYHVGRALPFARVQSSPMVVHLAIGTGIFVLLTAIPFLGALVWIAVWLVTFGAVLRTRFGQTPGAPLATTAIPPVPPPAGA
jgi:hypothetical protein